MWVKVTVISFSSELLSLMCLNQTLETPMCGRGCSPLPGKQEGRTGPQVHTWQTHPQWFTPSSSVSSTPNVDPPLEAELSHTYACRRHFIFRPQQTLRYWHYLTNLGKFHLEYVISVNILGRRLNSFSGNTTCFCWRDVFVCVEIRYSLENTGHSLASLSVDTVYFWWHGFLFCKILVYHQRAEP